MHGRRYPPSPTMGNIFWIWGVLKPGFGCIIKLAPKLTSIYIDTTPNIYDCSMARGDHNYDHEEGGGGGRFC